MELSDSERSINFPPKSRRGLNDFDEDEDIECDNPEFQIHVHSADAFQDVSFRQIDLTRKYTSKFPFQDVVFLSPN